MPLKQTAWSNLTAWRCGTDVALLCKSYCIVPDVIKERVLSVTLQCVNKRVNKCDSCVKSSCGDCKISDRYFISPRTLVNVTRRLTNLRSIWANKPLASIALSPFCSSDISFSRRMMAGNLSLTVLQALYLHAHRVSISLCNSLGKDLSLYLKPSLVHI